MKTIIRRGVFETNSSSSHSISIASEDKEFVMDTIYPDQNGVVRIVGDDFGWDWFKNNDAQTKASYVAQSYSTDQDILDKLADVIKEQTGADKVVFNLTDGYVDHDSYGVAPKTFHEMKNFIFNKNSWLFGGNDNSTASPEFYHVPEYRNGKMIYPEFKFELSIENFSETAKFLTKPTDEEISDAIYSLMGDTSITEGGHVIKDNSIMWQITRPRGIHYEIGLNLEQDFSTGEILLEKENNDDYYTIKKQMEEKGLFKGKNWKEHSKMVTEEMKKIPGIVKSIKFTINEIKSDE
jgi:hypothetical protein